MKLALRKKPLTDVSVDMFDFELKKDCLATFWRQATLGTTYWRCVVPARHLPGQVLGVTEKDWGEKKGKLVYPRQRGASIWQFLGELHRGRMAVAGKKLHGTRTLMEVDDNYTRTAAYQKGGQIRTFWHDTIAEADAAFAAGKGTGYSNQGHRLIVPEMDGIICSTQYLANVYSELNPNIYVCPNSIDPDDWEQFERRESETFRIVYYGSVSHRWDAPLVTRALKWASKQPGVTVTLAGFENPSWSFEHDTLPWTADLMKARDSLFDFDLGIAPLKGSPWTNGKSDVKALEYAMAGVMPLVSRAEPFRPWFDLGFDVADNEWEEAIRYAVANPEHVKSRAAEAKEYVLAERTIQKNIHLWREAVDGPS